MKSEKKGIKEATKILQELSDEESERILSEIGKKNAELAKLLREKLISFEDLIHLPAPLISVLMKDVGAEELGLAFRAASPEVKNHFLENIPQGMREEIETVLKGRLRALSDVLAARQAILTVVQEKIKSGEIFLDRGEKQTHEEKGSKERRKK